ncbi:hypothetical protein [Pacificibacter marinus]|uniref:hypothetical protein n=1 Tax=Pacificibacter marinus TaxID=658057 RepID=UPI001C07CED3|nr:hypothetical protein [Pacificibacter marinus]MBU2867135.1 hypothetical protein [Pacificibacter marinus]
MTDRKTLETHATELGIKFTDGWKDETIENRIAAQEKANAEANENAATGDVIGSTDVTSSTGVTSSADSSATGQSSEDQEHSKSGGYVDVTGPAKGRWRIGKHFTRQTQRIALADLKNGQLDALEADPELAVTVVPTA